jgi:diguanylate cyclase (GGDEF)-like protein/PAS domain S-box-containing protein
MLNIELGKQVRQKKGKYQLTRGQRVDEQTLELIQIIQQLQEEIGKYQRSQKALLATKVSLKRLLASSSAIVYTRNPSDNYDLTFLSDSIRKFGYQPTEFFEDENLWMKCIHPEDLPKIIFNLLKLKETKEQVCEYRFLQKDGIYRWIQDRHNLIFDEDNRLIEIVGSWQDITERKNIEQALFKEKELAQITLQSIGDGVIATDALGYINYLNPIAEKMTGWSLNLAKGKLLSKVFQTFDEITREPGEDIVKEILTRQTIFNFPEHTILISRDRATEYAIDRTASPIKNREGQTIGTVLVFRDVTKPRNLARQLSWQASHDALTCLFNRREFERKLIEAMKSAKEQNQEHILCYLDLDQFKVVNDTCGHIAGDELLRQIAELLKHKIRTSDTLARLGGDEFGIILNQCPQDAAIQIAQNIRKTIQELRFVWQDKTFAIGVSIGLVNIDADSDNLNSLLSAADAACYAAKDNGRNRVHIYQKDDRDLAKQRGERQWVSRINRALEENRFCLYSQTIVPIQEFLGSPIQHYEILLRTIDESGAYILPMAFIPAAERYGLMPRVDRWTISYFFANYHLVQARDKFPKNIYAINLSGASINDEKFFEFLKEQISKYNISPETICFEVTETVAIANLSKAAQFINELKQLGCYFALDDFGSGMSSFAYLKNLPIDYLKIDGNFVKDIVTDPMDSAIVECIHRISETIGVKTIAEFVENDEILAKLKNIGIHYAQGYGISKPAQLFSFKS